MADDNGYGWAIAKSLAASGAEILVGTWVPVSKFLFQNFFLFLFRFSVPCKSILLVTRKLLLQALNIFETSLRRGKFDESRL